MGGFGLRNLLNSTLPLLLALDQRVSPRAQSLYHAMRCMPKTFAMDYIRVLGVPRETGRRAIHELLRYGWAYTFVHPESGLDIVVPWMPRDIELAKARQVEELAETAPNRGEWVLKALLLLSVNAPYALYNHRHEWLVIRDGVRASESVKRLELDIDFPNVKVAVEFQGRQHYETVEFPSGRTDLQKQMALDRMKALACERRGYTLVEIPDVELSYETVLTKLQGKIDLIEPPKEGPLFHKLCEMAERHANWARNQRKNPVP